MAKQTRKSISIRGETYQHMLAYCQEHKLSVSGFVETLVAEFFRTQKPIAAKKTASNTARPQEQPFTLKGLKKETPPLASNGPVRGGGVHSL